MKTDRTWVNDHQRRVWFTFYVVQKHSVSGALQNVTTVPCKDNKRSLEMKVKTLFSHLQEIGHFIFKLKI